MKFAAMTLVVCLAPGLQAGSYDPVGKRDPFKPVVRPASTRHPGPLERFELDSLRLVAVMAGTSRPLALVECTDGVQRAIRIGTPIGRNHGRVSRITKDRVVVREQGYDATRRRRVWHLVELRIAEESERPGDKSRAEQDPRAELKPRR